jgi:hypothetical protein
VAAAISVWLRHGATAVAASRVGLGFVALGAPLLVSRSWVGRSGDGPSGRVLGRALGGRDLALGLGALIALQRQASAAGKPPVGAAGKPPVGAAGISSQTPPADLALAPDPGAASAPAAALAGAAGWVGLAALADGLDLLTTVRAWDELPTVKRWLVAASSGGAAAVGAAAAVSLFAGAVRRGAR